MLIDYSEVQQTIQYNANPTITKEALIVESMISQFFITLKVLPNADDNPAFDGAFFFEGTYQLIPQ